MRVLPVALTLLLTGCTIWRKEKRTAEVKGAIEATVAKVDRKKLGIGAIGGGHVGILVPEFEKTTSCELKITKPKTLTLHVPEPCDSGYQLLVDDGGRRLAYAPPGEEWSIVHFAKSGRSFDGVAHPAAGAIDWARVPKLEDEYVELFRHSLAQETNVSFKPVGDVLLDEIVEVSGEAELARVMAEASVAPAQTDRAMIFQTKRPLFARGLLRLHGDARERLLAELGKRLTTLTPGTDAASVRAALYLDLDHFDPKWSDALAAAARSREPGAWTPEIQYVAAMLLARKPQAATACTILERFVPEGAPELRREDLVVSLAVLATTKDSCAALSDYQTRLGDAWCTRPAWFCPQGPEPTHVCTPDEARAPFDAFFKLPLADARGLDLVGPDALTAAVLARKLEAPNAKQLRRQLYQHDMKAGAPKCYEAEAGPSCDPAQDAKESAMMCTAAATASDDVSVVHFDDAKKRYWFSPK